MSITYHLEIEERKGKHFLAVIGNGERRLVSGKEELKRICRTGRLYFRDQKVFFDPFATLSLSYVAEEKEGQVILRGRWKGAGQEGWLDEGECLCLLDPPCLYAGGMLSFFDDRCDRSWYAKVYPFPWKGSLASFKALPLEDEDAPTCDTRFSVVPLEPLPVLRLSDRHGAFAKLWMDYGDLGEIEFIAGKKEKWRNKETERGWEKDLLETGFVFKHGDYYCPLDRVAKSLTFLLEIGWKIFDAQDRRVFRQGDPSLSIADEGEVFVVKGSLRYAEHEVDLTRVVGAFNRQERFVSLDAHSVGLLDEQWKDVVVEPVKKVKSGVLGALWSMAALPPLADWRAMGEGGGALQVSPPTSAFKGRLFPYQQLGVDWLSWLNRLGLSGLLADEMGLGKTVQVLAFLSRLPQDRPVLIVAPTSLLFNWEQEIRQFLPDRSVHVYQGSKRTLESCSILLTSYAILRLDYLLLKENTYEVVILDEGQWIKNPESQISEASCYLNASMRIVLSGTPIENRADDLWALFRFLLPDLLGEASEFRAEVNLMAVDRRHAIRLKNKIRPFILRRKKMEVGIELPEKVIQTVWVEMTDAQREIYETWLKRGRSHDGKRSTILEAILRLRQICDHPQLVDGAVGDESGKMERLIADIEEVVAQGNKVLVYSQFTEMLQLIQQEIETRSLEYVYLDGATRDRAEVVRRFQEEAGVSVFLISLKAGGVGLNLTAADYVFLCDPWWNEAVENQAIDRAHRVGRSSRVIARRYITAMSIEEKLMRLKEHKSSLSEGLLEEGAGLSLDDLKELLN